jgi:hypothetical protein
LPRSQQGKWPGDDLAKYEHVETEDDYRHRMKMNMLGLIVTIVLMSAGVVGHHARGDSEESGLLFVRPAQLHADPA